MSLDDPQMGQFLRLARTAVAEKKKVGPRKPPPAPPTEAPPSIPPTPEAPPEKPNETPPEAPPGEAGSLEGPEVSDADKASVSKLQGELDKALKSGDIKAASEARLALVTELRRIMGLGSSSSEPDDTEDDDTEEDEDDVALSRLDTEHREKLADKNKALPDGSFPIENEEDLKNAIQAIGRAKNPARAKAHIKRRARALGKSDLIPEDW